MPENCSDLWPKKFEPVAVHSPADIMAEQADYLSDKTDGLVTARVEDATEFVGKGFRKRFVLVAPRLRGYSYVLFKVGYPVELYPVTVEDQPIERPDGTPVEQVDCETEDEFRALFEDILKCEKTGRIIASLMRESTAKAGA